MQGWMDTFQNRFEFLELREAISEFFGSETPSESKASTADSEQPRTDWTPALQLCHGDRELLQTLLLAFTEESPRLCHAIDQALKVGDSAAVQTAVHALKGTLRGLGFDAMGDLASQMEQQAGADELPDAELVWAQLRGQVNEMAGDARRWIDAERVVR